MNVQGTSSRSEWTTYAVAMLLVLFLGAASQALLVWINGRSQTQEQVIQSPGPVPRPAIAVAVPTYQNRICGVWRSETSGKQYNFACEGQNSFQVREINGQLQNNTGSGRVTESGGVEADLFILKRNRTAHLQLQLSENGQTMNGMWHGDDPAESGKLTFHRVGNN